MAHNCHGHIKKLTAISNSSRQKAKDSRQKQKAHSKTKKLTAKPKNSRQKQKAHGKRTKSSRQNKKLTAKTKSSRQKQKAHGKNKKLTAKTKSSRQKQKAHVRSAEVKPCRARLEIGWVTRTAPNIYLFSFLLYFPVSILFYCRFEFYFTV